MNVCGFLFGFLYIEHTWEKGLLLKKNLLLFGANSFLFEKTPFQKWRKNILTVLPPMKVYLNKWVLQYPFQSASMHLHPDTYRHLRGVRIKETKLYNG